jgi:hypothetical protein
MDHPMNTHDIKLPKLPAGVGSLRISEGRINIWVDNYVAEQQLLSGSVSVITTAQAEEYTRAAIEPYRKALYDLIRDLEMRSNLKRGDDKGVVDCGNGVYRQALMALGELK